MNNLLSAYYIKFNNNLRVNIKNNSIFNINNIWTFKITGD